MALSVLIGAFFSISMAQAAEKTCWGVTHVNNSYDVSALSEAMETVDDVLLCVTQSMPDLNIEFGYVGYTEGAGTLACFYKDASGSESYDHRFEWLSADYAQLQLARTYNPYLRDPAGMSTDLFLSNRVFEPCSLSTEQSGMFAQGRTYREEPMAAGDKATSENLFSVRESNHCMGVGTETVGGEKRRYFSFGTQSPDGKHCQLGKSRYYEPVDSDSTQSDVTQQSTDQVLATPASAKNKKCRFPEYVRGQTYVCKFDRGTDNGHYWIRDGKEMRHSASDLSECAQYNYKQRFCMDMKGHCIIGRKVKHDSDHNRNHCYICNEQITQEAKHLDWSRIKCITP
ncbi:hypothetical protein [Endozoicomonas sp. 4G]|uniref:hypothetical protein n=1 Tax=Endozoicomonas sp. 4G TaxID=2872754 RepID=UPI0020785C78|nr:hypothetical protein [Endozoicomonas sp. 4G]